LAILGGDLRADVLTAIVVGADLSPAHEEIIELRRRG